MEPLADPFGVLAGGTVGELVVPSAADFDAMVGRGGAAPVAPSEDPGACTQCGGQMERSSSGLEDVCSECGLVASRDTAALPDTHAPSTARLRVVGPNSGWLQPDLYRSSGGETTTAQKRLVYEEYQTYRQKFIETGGRAFPLNACQLAAEYYNEVQRQCVKRSQNKKTIMAACFRHACIELGFAPPKSEIAQFMQLPSRGIARGSNFVRAMAADGKMTVDVDADPCRAEITTLFALQGLEGGRFDALREAVHSVVQVAIRDHIGTSSILRSKIVGAAYVVLSRCLEPGLLPSPLCLTEFCRLSCIRKNTLERFTRQLDDYHSHFVDCYRAAGLSAAVPGEARPALPRPGKPASTAGTGTGGSAISRTAHLSTMRAPSGSVPTCR